MIDVAILIFIHICWYLYLLDICNQENLYNLTLVYAVIPTAEKNVKYQLAIKVSYVIEYSSVKKVTLSLSLKWPLAYILPVFQVYDIPTMSDKKFCVKSVISTKNKNQTSSQRP